MSGRDFVLQHRAQPLSLFLAPIFDRILCIRPREDYPFVTQIIDDPQYLNVLWVTSNNFRREADASKWDPRPYELILPAK